MRAEIEAACNNVRKARVALLDLIPQCRTTAEVLDIAREARQLREEFDALISVADAKWLVLDEAQWSRLMEKWGALREPKVIGAIKPAATCLVQAADHAEHFGEGA